MTAGTHADHPVAGQREVAHLVRAAACGDEKAWETLVERFAPSVWAVARGHRLNAADAADVSQTTWLRLVENLHLIREPDRVGAWLATTARRESLRLIRLSGRQVLFGDDLDRLPESPSAVDTDERLLAREADRVVQALVERLPRRSQVLIRLLSADSPLSYREISEVLDMPIGSIGPTRGRALQRLRQLAEQYQIDLPSLGAG